MNDESDCNDSGRLSLNGNTKKSRVMKVFFFLWSMRIHLPMRSASFDH